MSLRNFYIKNSIEVGCDEAGRGCLSGPVVAAAVILDPKKKNSTINDSKQLNSKKRIELEGWIKQNALAYGIAEVNVKKIDEINILNASFLAMHKAIDQISIAYDHLLIDGNRFNPYFNKPHYCLIKGDTRYKSIAAASILAKSYRDRLMTQLSETNPEYSWNKNFGYPTRAHRTAIKEYGVSEHHRLTFRLLPDSEVI